MLVSSWRFPFVARIINIILVGHWCAHTAIEPLPPLEQQWRFHERHAHINAAWVTKPFNLLARREIRMADSQDNRKRKTLKGCRGPAPKKRRRVDGGKKDQSSAVSSKISPRSKTSTGATLAKLPYEIVHMIVSELWAILPPHDHLPCLESYSGSFCPAWGCIERPSDRPKQFANNGW
ncbi:hypothetical protein B0T20DRAFT_488201 [Sordaria brevicollis]|uniref:Uncharacterized protein n=1 Tax=Sordaria brevicollis TaxID=83679 RepID=A0AAE0P369_SORBR|nr:hypothetical protein B0T20DRAFT_488201 [Sordaria brevicollis]